MSTKKKERDGRGIQQDGSGDGCDSLFRSVQLLSHVQLCDPMVCSMPGLPVVRIPPTSMISLK